MNREPKVDIRQGRCFELASRGLLDEHDGGGWRLVHGTVDSRGHRIDHAWLVRGDEVYDPVLNRVFSVTEYEVRYEAQAAREYERIDALALGAGTGHSGPWD